MDPYSKGGPAVIKSHDVCLNAWNRAMPNGFVQDTGEHKPSSADDIHLEGLEWRKEDGKD
jgi:hypothetical protein